MQASGVPVATNRGGQLHHVGVVVGGSGSGSDLMAMCVQSMASIRNWVGGKRIKNTIHGTFDVPFAPSDAWAEP